MVQLTTLLQLAILILAQNKPEVSFGNEIEPGHAWTAARGATILLRRHSLTRGTTVTFRANVVESGAEVRFEIWRPKGNNTYRLVGFKRYTPAQAGPVTVTVTNIGVQNGDVIGFSQVNPKGIVSYNAANLQNGENGDDVWTLEYNNLADMPRLWGDYVFQQWSPILKFALNVTINPNILPGPAGPAGSPGPVGPEGPAGPTGSVGVGSVGPPGRKGTKGVAGIDGTPGTRGDAGDYGEMGPKGVRGNTGDTGYDGVDGAKGQRGQRGDKGSVGDPGDSGESGVRGAPGDAGITGRGPRGDRGEKGPAGDTGFKGAKGNPGGLINNCTPGECHSCKQTVLGTECACNEGFSVMNKNHCKDTRCEIDNGGCHHKCVKDSQQRQTCECNEGYELQSDAKTCRMKDFCKQKDCGAYKECINTAKGAKCYGPDVIIDPPTSAQRLEQSLSGLRNYEMFVGLIIWACVMTIAELVILALIIYRIRQVRQDIKVHLLIANKQLGLQPDIDYGSTKYIVGPGYVTESSI